MDEIERLATLSDLYGETCHIPHGMWECEDPTAIDVLVIPIGYEESPGIEVQKRELTIPICKDCRDTLYGNDPEWLLFVCTECGNAQWKLRVLLNNNYPSGVLQTMKCCPWCWEEVI